MKTVFAGRRQKPPCLFPLPDGRRCCECDACQGIGREGMVTVWDADGCYLGWHGRRDLEAAAPRGGESGMRTSLSVPS